MLQRHVNQDSSRMPGALRYSGWISEVTEPANLRDLTAGYHSLLWEFHGPKWDCSYQQHPLVLVSTTGTRDLVSTAPNCGVNVLCFPQHCDAVTECNCGVNLWPHLVLAYFWGRMNHRWVCVLFLLKEWVYIWSEVTIKKRTRKWKYVNS